MSGYLHREAGRGGVSPAGAGCVLSVLSSPRGCNRHQKKTQRRTLSVIFNMLSANVSF